MDNIIEDVNGRMDNEWINEEIVLMILDQSSATQVSKDQLKDMDCCPVCLEEYNEDEKVFFLDCGHCYHPNCLIEWIDGGKRSCPMCRADIAK